MNPETIWNIGQAVAVVLGLMLGSFSNVCIFRMPADRSIVLPASHCPSCGHPVRPRDNVPVLSWLFLRGRCRDCGTAISSLYPTVELLVGILSWRLYVECVPRPAAMDLAHLAGFGVAILFVTMLVIQTFIDVRHYIIPDELSIYAVPVGVGAAVLLTWLGTPEALTWKQSVLGALFGGGGLAAVMGLYWLVRRRMGMGLGDVKLLAMIGSFLGAWPALPFVVFIASVAGAMVGVPLAVLQRKGGSMAVPFGPFLALGAVVWLLHGPAWMARVFPGVQIVFGV